ncbi:methyltransferase domain-containing protein [Flavobacterium sp. TMP13]|uniref:methyltransferase domain-containing protein n=1 Tax=Flavobacterium sp. TMP13 TaxID=3425950 RepID=UPI003D77462E
MNINTKYRTQETEIMDDFSLQGEELRDALDKIAGINQLLGGNKLTVNGVRHLLKKADTTKTITIADVGCGNGDMLRVLANYAKKNNLTFKLIGIDANAFTINYAKKLSTEYSNIEYSCVDIFGENFSTVKYDIVLCTLTLHHFTNDQILNIITTFNKNATIGIVINDLHRSKAAYRLFGVICTLFSLNKMSREDGLVSILRGFKKQELVDFSKKLNLKNDTINWKWAFRYQWIISKI